MVNCMNRLSGSIKYILVFALATFFVACKGKKKIQKQETQVVAAPDSTNSDKCKLDFKSGKVLANHVEENELDFKYVAAKLNCELTLDNEDHSFNVSLRCRKDSVIWMSISKLGIPAARAIITKDS